MWRFSSLILFKYSYTKSIVENQLKASSLFCVNICTSDCRLGQVGLWRRWCTNGVVWLVAGCVVFARRHCRGRGLVSVVWHGASSAHCGQRTTSSPHHSLHTSLRRPLADGYPAFVHLPTPRLVDTSIVCNETRLMLCIFINLRFRILV